MTPYRKNVSAHHGNRFYIKPILCPIISKPVFGIISGLERFFLKKATSYFRPVSWEYLTWKNSQLTYKTYDARHLILLDKGLGTINLEVEVKNGKYGKSKQKFEVFSKFSLNLDYASSTDISWKPKYFIEYNFQTI